MTTSQDFDFESEFRKQNDDWIRQQKLIDHAWPTQGLFHYSKEDSAKNIISSQTFHASFITTTSDPLEFTLPMVAIRDWITTSGNLLDVDDEESHEMIRLFKFFNDESRNPTLRPYFMSLCTEKNKYLGNCYGDVCIKLLKNTPMFPTHTYLIKVCYEEDVQAYINKKLNNWIETIVIKVNSNFTNEQISKNFGITFHLWMETFILLSLSVKQKKFEKEKEYRLVIFNNTPDKSARWHEPRVIKPSDFDSLGNIRPGSPRREYLPLKLSALGLKAQKTD